MPRYPRVPAPEPGRWFSLQYLRRLGFVVVCAALAATLLFAWFAQRTELPVLARTFLTGMVYSVLIGLPCGLILPHLAHRTKDWPRRQNLLIISGAILVVTVIGCLAAGGTLVLSGLTPPERFWPEFTFTARISAVIALVFGMSAFLYESMRTELENMQLQLRTKELERERAHKLLAEAQLSSLESRIHPHFLFNTLNSIASLIPEDPKRADDMIGKLAALLRFSLDAHRQPLVPLSQELKIVRDYLEIEKARFGDRLRYAIEIAPELETLEVPPLALQSLVENSIKHAITPRREGGEVRVGARFSEGRLELTVTDTGPGFSLAAVPPGHGLDNLQSRLAVLFGPSARLDIDRDGGLSAVRITLPQPVRA